jgi:hypothetical protein
MSSLSRILGIGSAIFICLFAFLYNSGVGLAYLIQPGDLIRPGEMIGVLFIPIGLVTASFGFSGLKECLSLPVRITPVRLKVIENQLIAI